MFFSDDVRDASDSLSCFGADCSCGDDADDVSDSFLCFCAACGNDADDASIVCCHATAHGNDASDWLLSFVSLAAKMLIILAIVCFLRCCPRQ